MSVQEPPAWSSALLFFLSMNTTSEQNCHYTPRNEVVGGYTGFTMSVRL